METKKITVNITETDKVELSSDSPNLAELVEAITRNRDQIDPNNFSVESEDPEFDSDSFKEVIVEATEKYLEAIKIDEEQFNKVIKSLESEGAE